MAEEDAARAAAMRAAEALTAEGGTVTARAVRERAGVAMTVAVQAAREWKAAAAEGQGVPPVPDVVQARAEGLWAEAVRVARAEHDQAVDGWKRQLRQMETERDEAIAAVDEHAVAARVQQEAAEAAIAGLREQVRALGEDARREREEADRVRQDLGKAREEAAEARGQATVLREQLARERMPAADGE